VGEQEGTLVTYLHLRPDMVRASRPRMVVHGLYERDTESPASELGQDGEASELHISRRLA
jgi:hypothetical protein